ncbi:MAG: hypothetical protein AB9M53_00765 [Leptothrix sp. (in: b-proteobacteria)]
MKLDPVQAYYAKQAQEKLAAMLPDLQRAKWAREAANTPKPIQKAA